MPDAGLEPANRCRIAAITRIVMRFSLIRLQTISSNLWQRATPFLFWGLASPDVQRYTLGMTEAKKRSMNSVLLFVAFLVAAFVGAMMIALSDNSIVVIVGALLILASVVFLILAIVQYGRDVRTVATVVMGAAVKLNNQPPQPKSWVADEIGRLTTMHQAGSLSDAEFAAAKTKALAN